MTIMELKENRFNSWEWNMPTSELHGNIYVADDDEGNLVMMAETESADGSIIDIEIIGISDDFETVTVSTGTAFGWGYTVCIGHENMREAYLTMSMLLRVK